MDLRAVEFAHDLKMPIQLIYSCVQLLEMEMQPGSRAGSYLKMLMQSARQLQTMVTNALDDEGDPHLRMEYHDVAALVRNICRQTELFAHEKHVCICFQENAAAFSMKTDSEKLGRILHNLLSNALRFTPEGGRVDVVLQVLGDALEISVSDTGCGIPENMKAAVFERGVSDGGHGHGLCIVREYAKMLGGSIRLERNENMGCRFVLRLPVRN